MIPKIKNNVILFQPYIPKKIFSAMSYLLEIIQKDIKFSSNVVEILYEAQSGKIESEKMEEIQQNVLLAISIVETKIKLRLTELSK